MKKFMKFFGIAVFAAVLFANVSIKANKSTGDAPLVGFVSEANAACEEGTFNMFRCTWNNRCTLEKGQECDPHFSWLDY
jgi:hypothetical protein